MSAYNFKEIEKKWQNKWEKEGTFNAKDDYTMKKWYGLIEFPYPSGQGLHVGHPRSYTALDIIARKRRLEGYNVLYPIGFDAFGLPAENYAIKTNIHPRVVTAQNIEHFKEQLKSIGFSFDWSREINTTEPEYYKWSQWIFVQLFKKGLAYKATMPINYCTGCKVGLANEEVVNGVCERCGSPVVQKEKSQWMLKITDYAERLLNDLDDVNYLEKIKTQQRNWIGRSEGAEVKFQISNSNEYLEIYTTRPDTMFGATYMVVAPEHPIISKLADRITNMEEIEKYKEDASKKSDFERTEIEKDKTGVEIKGIRAINPADGKEIPIWISDYVLITYGTGAIMAVPAHDDRDFAFATKFGLPIKQVITDKDNTVSVENEAYSDKSDGYLINSDFLNGLSVNEAIDKMIKFLEDKNIGTKKVNYKLRDWVFSRQRYWGEPIPMVYCEKCGWVPLDEKDLPLVLPEVEEFKPGENGESPLAALDSWIKTTCPHCGGTANRETDTMPQWAGSSWYFLRYIDPNNTKEFASKEALNYWLPIDWYNGGMEHTTLHLLYSRFWHKFLYDIGEVPTQEPYAKRTSHGMILGGNGEKMSKSKGNVVNPDDIVKDFGADAFRTYEMFIGPFDQSTPWSMESLRGCSKFLDRVWNLQTLLVDGDSYSDDFDKMMNKSIKKISSDFEEMKFNTAVATLMTMVNEFYRLKRINRAELNTFLILLNPIAPHVSEEIYSLIGNNKTIAESSWPNYDEAKTIDDEIEIPIQVNGKLKATIMIVKDSEEDIVKQLVHEKISDIIDGKNIVKEIYVKNKIYNIVVK
ncbi:MAG: leucine--tRNA ligase [Clostridia bacterium]|nr:leucine--tRNA ligase [Clostridia bacterium]